MGSSWVGKTRGTYLFSISVILFWLGGKVVVVEEGLENDGGELDDDEYDWLISGLGDLIAVDTIDEVMVKEGGFTTSEVCKETPRVAVVRVASLVDCWV